MKKIFYLLGLILFTIISCDDDDDDDLNKNPFSIQNVSCKSLNDGGINITINEGQKPFSFLWSNGDTSEDLVDVSAGLYSVKITDANGNVKSFDNIKVSEPDELNIGFSINHISDFGKSDGSISLSISGGTEPYSYNWSNGEKVNSIKNLNEGEYEVLVTDSNSCNKKSKAIIFTLFTDNRDDEEYKTVKIGNDIWFAENIRTNYDSDGNLITRNCMDTDINCENGGLYTHEIAKKVCPRGWHLSTDDNWKAVELYAGMSTSDVNDIRHRGNIANNLLEGGFTNLNIKITGFRFEDRDFGTVYNNQQTYFWAPNRDRMRAFEIGQDWIWRQGIGPHDTVFWMSCRCVKDN